MTEVEGKGEGDLRRKPENREGKNRIQKGMGRKKKKIGEV